MGQIHSHPNSNVFAKELMTLNNIVKSIIANNDLFKNKNYNFLSEDFCSKYQIFMEDELQKHLKVNIQPAAKAIYFLPKSDDSTKLEQFGTTKKELCQSISKHYIKVLYTLAMIKYVYDLERNGDLSIAGILFRNIKIVNGIIEINFCDLPHRDYKQLSDKTRIDFGQLEGFKIFVSQYLEKDEAVQFINVVRSILSRSNKSQLKSTLCQLKNQSIANELFAGKYNEKLVCDKNMTAPKGKPKNIPLSLDVFVEKHNPILSKDYCFSTQKYIIKIDSPDGKKVINKYKTFRKNYSKNIKQISSLIDMIVIQHNKEYQLKNINSSDLDAIIEKVKSNIKTFYTQSIIDYQNILDTAKIVNKIVT